MTLQQPEADATSPAFPSSHWEQIATYLEEGLVIVNSRDTVVFFNAAAETLTGAAQTQVRGVAYDRVFAANPWVVRLIRHAQASGYSRTAGEGELQDRRGQAVPIRMSCSPVFDKADRLLGFVMSLHDLRYQRELAEERQRDDQLASLGVVVAGLAHEIKNPLAGIRGATQLLQSRLQADHLSDAYTEIMVREIDRLSALLEQLLELAARPAFDPRPVNIHKTLSDVLLLEEAAAPKGSSLRTEFDPSLPTILGDEARLAQVFRNLIKNGLQALHQRRGGVLNISTRMATDFHLLRSPAARAPAPQPGMAVEGAPPPVRPAGAADGAPQPDLGRFLCITFADNGPGIEPDHLAQLFTPFFTTKSQGTGLGLSVSQQIITQHGGTIRVDSSPGSGACFHVYLPVPLI